MLQHMEADLIPSKKKQNNAELEDRYDHMITLLAKGLKRAQILVDPLVLSWRMSIGSIDKYLQRCKGEIVSNAQQARTEHLGRAIMNLDYLYSLSMSKTIIETETVNEAGPVVKTYRPVEDPLPAVKLCLDIQKEKNKLLQLSKVYDPDGLPPEETMLPDAVHKLLDEVKVVNAPKVREIDLNAEVGKSLIAGSSG